jgi:general stress protein 26
MSEQTLQQALDYLREHPDTQLATVDGDQPWVRAMWLARVEDGALWYATARQSPKAGQIARNPKVCVSAYDTHTVARVFGTATVVDDPAAKAAVWSEGMARYFTGPEDPELVLIRVEPVTGEFGTMM